MGDAQVLREEGVLRADVVIEGDAGPGAEGGGVRGGGGLAVAEEGGDHDVVLFGGEDVAEEPLVVGDCYKVQGFSSSVHWRSYS